VMARKLALTCVIKWERKVYSAVCPELDVASQGNTPAEARRNLKEAVIGRLLVAQQEGMLDEILEQSGIKKNRKTVIMPMSVPLPA